MDDVQQLGEMLRHYADSEAHKKQQFDLQSARWAQKLGELFGQIEQWLEPVKTVGLLDVHREAYVASSPSLPVESSTFRTEKLTVQITGKAVEFVPEVMECHLVSGDFDYLIKARLPEMNKYRQLLGEILKRLPASAESRSYVVMEEIKETLYLAVDR